MSYPKNTAEALEHLYSNADPSRDWAVLYVDEDTRDITHWDSKLGEKPSIDAIKSAESDGVKNTKLKNIRKKRNRLLAETDWMSGSDVTMSDKWKKYRQDLRDLPASNADPSKIVFPTKPE